ncbi:hypothetical protein CANCADRAFT_3981 [Tortispora caseinolytica NRRL Y-17796]|uniref:DH domain-containing protein n=1 Tax=Tortispora caseinolytica NRRL Y-17796 TaxID=767744 RepID=A0A1E4TCB4_9ASCO|nr:hypothetical protein CANCADRAFT_3981 [Tortispora caseinolytica NRRL Y-17796]
MAYRVPTSPSTPPLPPKVPRSGSRISSMPLEDVSSWSPGGKLHPAAYTESLQSSSSNSLESSLPATNSSLIQLSDLSDAVPQFNFVTAADDSPHEYPTPWDKLRLSTRTPPNGSSSPQTTRSWFDSGMPTHTPDDHILLPEKSPRRSVYLADGTTSVSSPSSEHTSPFKVPSVPRSLNSPRDRDRDPPPIRPKNISSFSFPAPSISSQDSADSLSTPSAVPQRKPKDVLLPSKDPKRKSTPLIPHSHTDTTSPRSGSIASDGKRLSLLSTPKFKDADITYLNFSKATFDTIPDWVFQCSKLKHLVVTDTKLSIVDPRISSNLKELESLDLSRNAISTFPAHLVRLSGSLQVLNLEGNPVWKFATADFKKKYYGLKHKPKGNIVPSSSSTSSSSRPSTPERKSRLFSPGKFTKSVISAMSPSEKSLSEYDSSPMLPPMPRTPDTFVSSTETSEPALQFDNESKRRTAVLMSFLRDLYELYCREQLHYDSETITPLNGLGLQNDLASLHKELQKVTIDHSIPNQKSSTKSANKVTKQKDKGMDVIHVIYRIQELLSTENTYVHLLEEMMGVLNRCMNSKPVKGSESSNANQFLPSAQDAQVIYDCLNPLLEFHKLELLPIMRASYEGIEERSKIEEEFDMSAAVSGAVQNICNEFIDSPRLKDIYLHYIDERENANRVSEEWDKDKRTVNWFQTIRQGMSADGQGQPNVSSYVLLPMQRITRYKLLLQHLSEIGDTDVVDRAVKRIDNIADQMEYRQRLAEGKRKIMEIHSQFKWPEGVSVLSRETKANHGKHNRLRSASSIDYDVQESSFRNSNVSLYRDDITMNVNAKTMFWNPNATAESIKAHHRRSSSNGSFTRIRGHLRYGSVDSIRSIGSTKSTESNDPGNNTNKSTGQKLFESHGNIPAHLTDYSFETGTISSKVRVIVWDDFVVLLNMDRMTLISQISRVSEEVSVAPETGQTSFNNGARLIIYPRLDQPGQVWHLDGGIFGNRRLAEIINWH